MSTPSTRVRERPCQAKNPALCPHHGLSHRYETALTAYLKNPSLENFDKTVAAKSGLDQFRTDPKFRQEVLAAADKYERTHDYTPQELVSAITLNPEPLLKQLRSPAGVQGNLTVTSNGRTHAFQLAAEKVEEDIRTYMFKLPDGSYHRVQQAADGRSGFILHPSGSVMEPVNQDLHQLVAVSGEELNAAPEGSVSSDGKQKWVLKTSDNNYFTLTYVDTFRDVREQLQKAADQEHINRMYS